MKCAFCTDDVDIMPGKDCGSCVACHTLHYYMRGVLYAYQFNFQYRGSTFWVCYMSLTDKTEIFQFGKKLLEIDGKTNITPFNVATKLPTILTFL
jgi:hypothetical protein